MVDELRPDDLRRVARLCAATLESFGDRDWSLPAFELEWSAQYALTHVTRALLSYSTRLAIGAMHRIPMPWDPDSVALELDPSSLEGAAAVLTAVVEAAPEGRRAYHVMGIADITGSLAMGCDEMLIHTDDIARGFDAVFTPPPDIARRVLVRLFPWAPADADPWDALRWANGRVALPGHQRLAPNWGWHCAPLSEWDGTTPTAD